MILRWLFRPRARAHVHQWVDLALWLPLQDTHGGTLLTPLQGCACGQLRTISELVEMHPRRPR